METTDEMLMQKLYDLLDPLVRAERTVECVTDMFDGAALFFCNGAAVTLGRSEFRIAEYCDYNLPAPLRRMTRVQKTDGSDAWRLFDAEKRKVATIEISYPTDPLPRYVAALREQLIGAHVQSVSVTDGGLCLHLDDDYDAVTNGAGRVRVDSTRVPFTVGDVFVNRGGGDLSLCVCARPDGEDKDSNRPVVAFKIDRDILDRKELSFNVI